MEFIHDGNSIPAAPTKDPDSIIDYGADWSNWLQDGETISTSEWFAGPGLSLSEEQRNGAVTKVTLSGGTAGEFFTLTNRITTSFGRQEDRSMKIRCVHK